MTQLTISILVHEDFSHIHTALSSILQQTTTSYQVYVVINAGSGDKVQDLRTAFPDLNYIINETPQGFAANHNQVMRLADTPYVALLNDDIDIQEAALDKLVAYLDEHAQVGIVAPQLQNADGSPQVTVYSDPSLFRMIYKISGLGRYTHQQSTLRRLVLKLGGSRFFKTATFKTYTESQLVDVVKAAAIMVRRRMLQEVGLIDQATKVFGEEIDWNLRMRRAGWNVAIVPQAKITHYGVGQATSQVSGWQLVEDRKAILNYYLKHRPTWQAVIIRCAIIILHMLQLIISIIVAPKDMRTHFDIIRMASRWKMVDRAPQLE